MTRDIERVNISRHLLFVLTGALQVEVDVLDIKALIVAALNLTVEVADYFFNVQ